ncbi:SDR family NAD(P)-dependent oxidoreductase [Aromatoleum diolicum]|uniref:SDR family oxidoreductase n=1 Tax=Aromatoleum diolicum TaxID=75796 RepID=A0ABX1QDW1_9RHOO|nr:SDR family oxidoreductase [Aromatoleum diolicum]NMG76569.1 SDR family oxidoreductase [Aromatoleum diolicum]
MTNTQNIWVPALNECGVLIAGGTSGVGLATAEQFAAAGVRGIGLVGRNAERGEKARCAVAERYPGVRVVFIQADANRADEAVRAVAEATAQLGSVDVLVNATVGPFGPMLFHETPIEDIPSIVTQQLMGPLIMSRAVMPGMREKRGGVIISISSDAGKVATPGESVIGAAMAGINMFSKGLAMEAKRTGIRVNAITPSLIEGTLTYDRIRADPFSWKIFERAAAQAHLGVVQPDDLASLIVFLASPQGARITGQVISVNGGISAA